jgi:hypothetical protein
VQRAASKTINHGAAPENKISRLTLRLSISVNHGVSEGMTVSTHS